MKNFTTIRRNTVVTNFLTTIAVVSLAVVSGAHAEPRAMTSVDAIQSDTPPDTQTRSGDSGGSSATGRPTERDAVVVRVQPTQPARVVDRMISGNIDGRDIEIRIENGNVFASVDGVEVDPERIKIRGGRTTILDEDGRVLQELTLGWAGDPVHGGLRAAQFLERMRVEGVPALRVDGLQPGAPAPRAMLGVHLDDPSEALQSHLGLLPKTATIITQVIAGLAAAEAGLQPHDVIISVDGRRPASQAMLRETIASSDPGTTLRLEVIRGGVVRETTVRLADFERSRLVAPLGKDAIDLALRARIGPHVNVDILHDVDDRMRRHLFIASGEAEVEGEGLPNQVKDFQTRAEMLFQAVPGSIERSGFGPGVYRSGGPATDDRLQALEATVQTLTERIDRLVELMQARTTE